MLSENFGRVGACLKDFCVEFGSVLVSANPRPLKGGTAYVNFRIYSFLPERQNLKHT